MQSKNTVHGVFLGQVPFDKLKDRFIAPEQSPRAACLERSRKGEQKTGRIRVMKARNMTRRWFFVLFLYIAINFKKSSLQLEATLFFYLKIYIQSTDFILR